MCTCPRCKKTMQFEIVDVKKPCFKQYLSWFRWNSGHHIQKRLPNLMICITHRIRPILCNWHCNYMKIWPWSNLCAGEDCWGSARRRSPMDGKEQLRKKEDMLLSGMAVQNRCKEHCWTWWFTQLHADVNVNNVKKTRCQTINSHSVQASCRYLRRSAGAAPLRHAAAIACGQKITAPLSSLRTIASKIEKVACHFFNCEFIHSKSRPKFNKIRMSQKSYGNVQKNCDCCSRF